MYPWVLRWVRNGLALLRRQVREVEAGTAEVVFRLTDVHPEAGQVHAMQLLLVGHGRESLLLDRGRLELYLYLSTYI